MSVCCPGSSVSVPVKWETKELRKKEEKHTEIGLKTSQTTLCVYLNTHIRPSFEAAHNKFKLFPHTGVMGLKSFRSVRGLIEEMSREDDVKEWGTSCFSESRRSLTPAELMRRSHVIVKEPHGESKCANETAASFPVTRRMVSGWCDLISNVTVTITELWCTKAVQRKPGSFLSLTKTFFLH